MKRFADLHLCIPFENFSRTKKMIHNASELGYSMLGIPFPLNAKKEDIINVQKICNEVNLDFVSRVNIYPRNSKELIQKLRKYRRKFEIIGVRCNTKDVARHAAKDRRVDLLQFSITNLYKRFFDEKEAELSSQSLSGLEIELAPIFELNTRQKIRTFSKLQREVIIAQKAKVPIIISSGASNELLMRGPYDYSAFATLFDISFEDSLNAISKNPVSIVEKNREKLSTYFVAPGIKVVGRKITD